jgi:glycosyltransferase involved in cell wall biosynthesis
VVAVPAPTRLHGVLVTFRRPDDLRRTLERLAEQTRPLDSLTVVDNSPGQDVRDALADYSPKGFRTEHIESQDNTGPAGGLALGMSRVLEYADDADWLVVLDDDDPPRHADLLADALRFAEACRRVVPDTGAVGTMGARFDWATGRTVRPTDEELVGPVAVDYIGGNRFPLYSAAALRQVGVPWPELFFGLDDLEIGLRLKRNGYALFAPGEPWAAQRRAAGRPGGPVRPSLVLDDEPSWRRYYSLRNSIVILRRYGATRAALRVTLERGLLKPLLNAPRSPRLALRHLRLSAEASRDAWTGRLGRTHTPPDSSSRPVPVGSRL